MINREPSSGSRNRRTAAFCLVASATIAAPTAGRADEQSALLAACPGREIAARVTVALPRHGEEVLALVDAAAPELKRCRTASLGAGAGRVRWLGAISQDDAQTARRIVLTLREDDLNVTAAEVEPPIAVPVEPPRLMPRTQLFSFQRARLFGVGERARMEQGLRQFTLVCAPGVQPAGAVLALGTPSFGAKLELELEADGDDGFHAQVTAEDEVAAEPGLPLTGRTGRRGARLPMPMAQSVSLVVSCPLDAGRLRVHRAAVISARSAEFERPAAWVWSMSRWRDHSVELLAAAQELGLGTLFITIPIDVGGVSEPDRLAEFVARAKAAAIDVVAVEGDPIMVFGDGRAEAVGRARALAVYQAAVPATSRLSGVQYDIEPYILAGFVADPAATWQAWGDTLAQLAAAFGSPVDAVIPCWIIGSSGGSQALSSTVSSLRQVTIMAYRTTPDAIIAAAEPALAWAAAHGLPASVALESGLMPRERRDTFVRAGEGELHIVPLGHVAALVLFDQARAGTRGRVFRFDHSVRIDSNRVSFAGDAASLTRVAAGIGADLAAWPVVRGFAFHGLAEVDPLAPLGRAAVQERVP